MRVLVCLDPVPAADGSCAQQAFVDQPSWSDYLPTREQANAIGGAMFAAVVIVVVLGQILNPTEET